MWAFISYVYIIQNFFLKINFIKLKRIEKIHIEIWTKPTLYALTTTSRHILPTCFLFSIGFGSSINMDFPLIFTFCFSSPDRRFGAHALFSSYKILSIQLKKSTSLQSIISLPKITYSFRSRGAHTYLFAWGRDS